MSLGYQSLDEQTVQVNKHNELKDQGKYNI